MQVPSWFLGGLVKTESAGSAAVTYCRPLCPWCWVRRVHWVNVVWLFREGRPLFHYSQCKPAKRSLVVLCLKLGGGGIEHGPVVNESNSEKMRQDVLSQKVTK